MNAPTIPPIPANLNRAHLAFELACDLLAQPDILSRFELTKDQLAHLVRHDPQFRHQYRAYKEAWGAPKNTRERVQLKAGLAVEDGMPELYAIFRNPEIATQQRLEAFKQLTNLADVAPKKDGMDIGSRFTVNINLGTPDAPEVVVLGQSEAEPDEPIGPTERAVA